ncbi:hypothetical protein C6A85_11170, partial [Mycobacterium sp. ITM-2017-0098]
ARKQLPGLVPAALHRETGLMRVRPGNAEFVQRHGAHGEIAAGATLAGRYRLTAQQGRMRSVQFWRGVDTASAQSVAITLIV